MGLGAVVQAPRGAIWALGLLCEPREVLYGHLEVLYMGTLRCYMPPPPPEVLYGHLEVLYAPPRYYPRCYIGDPRCYIGDLRCYIGDSRCYKGREVLYWGT